MSQKCCICWPNSFPFGLQPLASLMQTWLRRCLMVKIDMSGTSPLFRQKYILQKEACPFIGLVSQDNTFLHFLGDFISGSYSLELALQCIELHSYFRGEPTRHFLAQEFLLFYSTYFLVHRQHFGVTTCKLKLSISDIRCLQ